MPYYKATRENGRDFFSGSVDYAAALESGTTLTHPSMPDEYEAGVARSDASFYWSVATVPTDCTGMSWPCRLFEVEPVGETWQPDPTSLPNKVACRELRVVRELEAVDALGPQGSRLRDLIGQATKLTEPQARKMVAARGAARGAAWDAARDAARGAARGAAWDAAWGAARGAAWDAAWGAAWDAAWALSVRDLISETGFTQAHYDLLVSPWVSVMGKVHPDDK